MQLSSLPLERTGEESIHALVSQAAQPDHSTALLTSGMHTALSLSIQMMQFALSDGS